jgi:sulfoxide reductase catalytic subunit YedY
MLIKVRQAHEVKSSEITDRSVYAARRRFLQGATAASFGVLTGALARPTVAVAGNKLNNVVKGRYAVPEPPNSYEDMTSYNNFYEFSVDKEAPARLAQNFITRPWTLTVEGEVAKPAVYQLEDFIKPHALEERIYRFRCVEAWSMVIPWVGIPLAEVIKRLQPTSKAKYVEFVTLLDPKQMPGQQRAILQWPYREGLRMDEAMHPLTILAVGLYGEELPNQNGAPIRLVVPWKYGFKSIKSIVKLRFTEQQPQTTWAMQGPREYGFYANVNPEVDHPRWSQAKERRIGEFLKRKTLKFNGYEEEVASLYAGMDLRVFY